MYAKNPKSMTFWAARNLPAMRIDVVLVNEATKTCAAPPTMSPMEEGEYMTPFLSLSEEEAKLLMDQLWDCGVRPSNGNGNEGQLAATQAHLKDMQLIAMGFLKTHFELSK